jgi:hypothetical protein
MNRLLCFILLISGILILSDIHAQEKRSFKSNVFSVNLTSCLVNELQGGLEHFFTKRTSVEINGGLIFVNDFLEDQTKDWKNAQVFSEHGYAVRIHLKLYTNTDDEMKKWKSYIAPGIIYKDLYYNEQWFEYELGDEHKYYERIYQSRTRMKGGIEFLWGKVYHITNTLSLDFYYGGGIVATTVKRHIIQYQPDSRSPEIQDINKTDDSFYVRPIANAGIKLCLSF